MRPRTPVRVIRALVYPILLLALIGCVLNNGGAIEYSLRNAKRDYEKDLENDRLKILQYGYLSLSRSDYDTLLEERFGVNAEMIAGCIVSEPLLKYADKYNSLVEQELERRHGEGVLDDLWKEADATYRKRIDEASQDTQ